MNYAHPDTPEHNPDYYAGRSRGGVGAGFFRAFGPGGDGAAQGRWKTARMVEVYTRSEGAGRAAKWLA
ncbi:MAG: hypothetical protein OXK78_00870 [Caldilineaceae bacterium]|nr:hypothetical protein [Caldilineaceae bacterium]